MFRSWYLKLITADKMITSVLMAWQFNLIENSKALLKIIKIFNKITFLLIMDVAKSETLKHFAILNNALLFLIKTISEPQPTVFEARYERDEHMDCSFPMHPMI